MADCAIVDGLEQSGALPDGISGRQGYAASNSIVDGLRSKPSQKSVHSQKRFCVVAQREMEGLFHGCP